MNIIVALLLLVVIAAMVGFGGIGYLTGASRDPSVRKLISVPLALGSIGLMTFIAIDMHSPNPSHEWLALALLFGSWVAGLALGYWRRPGSDNS